MPPAQSQSFGPGRRARRSSPAAVNAHSIAAEPVWRVSQGRSCPKVRSRCRVARLGRQMTAQLAIETRRDRSALEAQATAVTRVVHAGLQRVTRRAPRRADHGMTAIEQPDGRREQRKAVDEVRRAVDRIDGPDEIRAATGSLVELLADDVVLRKAFGEARAHQHFGGAVDFGDWISPAIVVTRAVLVRDGERTIERVLDLRAGETHELHRRLLELAQLRFGELGSRIAHDRKASTNAAAPGSVAARHLAGVLPTAPRRLHSFGATEVARVLRVAAAVVLRVLRPGDTAVGSGQVAMHRSRPRIPARCPSPPSRRAS